MLNKKNNDWQLTLQRKVLLLFRKYSIPRWFVFTFDILAVSVTFLFAYLLRFNFTPNDFVFSFALSHSLIALLIYGLFFLIFRSYSGLIRHTTLTDISLVFGATTASVVTLLAFSLGSRLFQIEHDLIIPVSVILIHYGIITIFLFSIRLGIKLLFRIATRSAGKLQNVLIYGAGEMGVIIKRLIMSDPKHELNIVGFLDDNRQLYGKKINGIPVFSRSILNDEFIKKRKIKTLIIAIENITTDKKKEIIHFAINLGLAVLKIPSATLLRSFNIEALNLEKVKIEDLLDRGPNILDLKRIEKGIRNKAALITGAAGSIGSELARQILKFYPSEMILIDQAETPLTQLESNLKNKAGKTNLFFELADITNYEKAEIIFRKYKPDIIFHIASYKHIPVLEMHPHEAFRVNVGGTKIMAELSVLYNASGFVLISSDKCFQPNAVMSFSKRLSEMVVQALAGQGRGQTKFIITRFGNVLGSSGSVIPLFTEQITKGGPLTVTHPDISRYFMTIPGACELILEAAFMDNKGEIFNFDMGEPVKIVDVADKMIRISGLEPGKDIEIVYTGLRPGEKLHDENAVQDYSVLPTSNPGITIIEGKKYNYSNILEKIDEICKKLYSINNEEIIKIMEDIVNKS